MPVLKMMVPMQNSNKNLKNLRNQLGIVGGLLGDYWGTVGGLLGDCWGSSWRSYSELLSGEAFSYDVWDHMLFPGGGKGGAAGPSQLWLPELAPAPATRGSQGAKALGPPSNNTRRDPLRKLRGRRITFI